jgi:uncharacterized membrane protein
MNSKEQKNVTVTSKKPWLSKTYWFNILAAIVLVATVFGYTGEFSSQEVADKVNAFLPLITIIGNLILRKVTKQPVDLI